MQNAESWSQYLKRRRNEILDILKEYLPSGSSCETDVCFTAFTRQLRANNLKELKVACIMDKFTLESYRPECDLLELTPGNWKAELESFQPELLFVESAWQGKDNLWYRKIANGSSELYHLSDYCHEKEIPVIFWNKEDPVYTDTFIPAARCADFVFTTDIDCIKKYKEILGHDNVFFLHFAAQPQIHNPIEKYERKDKYCFAGAYYHRYPARAKVFDEFAEYFIETKGLDIYDRNYQNPQPEFQFPDKYRDNILGCLDSKEIDVAYKGYNYGINMNSVTQSQTMFARRVFEMLASNTVTVGNFSRGVRNFFGDLTISTDDAVTLKKELQLKCNDDVTYRKYRLLGLRKALMENLYEDRLDYIVKKVFGKSLKSPLPQVLIVAKADNKTFPQVLQNFDRQAYPNKSLILIGNCTVEHCPSVKVITDQESAGLLLRSLAPGAFIGVMSGNNYYGKNYLTDLMLTLRYTHSHGMGKAAFYSYSPPHWKRMGDNCPYRFVKSLLVDRAVFRVETLDDMSLAQFIETKCLEDTGLYSIDEFNFCEGYISESCDIADDLQIWNQGIALEQFETTVENISAAPAHEAIARLDYRDLSQKCKGLLLRGITISEMQEKLVIKSSVQDDKPRYIYFNDIYPLKDYTVDKCLNIQLLGKGDLDLLGVCLFLDEKKKQLDAKFFKLNLFSSYQPPVKARFFKLGFRVKGEGKSELCEIVLGAKSGQDEFSSFLSRSEVLVLTNHYPSKDNLYRNMFVHKRVLAYKKEGLLCDVMRVGPNIVDGYREFQGIDILEGQAEKLGNILENGNIRTVCVHFMDWDMWNVLKLYRKKIRLIIWLHGADIQPWWRRKYLYNTPRQLSEGKQQSERRQLLWDEIFHDTEQEKISFVTVSEYSARIIAEDYHIDPASDKWQIIHNYIDFDTFRYTAKDSSQRKKILSIRPYASAVYANDLSVKAIEKLSGEPFFKDLEFLIVGDGPLFESTTRPLRKYKNVILQKRFLTADEIAGLHQEYGLFLVPTRMDTQGVSRDEAMSSGLVPLTNSVAAIPEFTDETCAVLAPEENFEALAEGIRKLYYNPELFQEMSKNAAMKVRQLSSMQETILKEVSLIRPI